MASKNKFRKVRNSYCANVLKFGKGKLKRVFFYDTTQRKLNKKLMKIMTNFNILLLYGS